MNTKAKHLLVIIIALGLLCMAAAVVYQRLTSPSLVTAGHAGGAQPSPAAAGAMPEGMGEDSEMGRLMRMVGDDPDNVQNITALGTALISQQKYREAGIFFERAHALDKENPRILYYLGYIAHQEGDHKKAAELMEEALSKENLATVHFSLANIYRWYLKDEALAQKHFRLGLEAPDCTDEERAAYTEALGKEPQK